MAVAKGQLALHGLHVLGQRKDEATGKMIDVTEPMTYVVDWSGMNAGDAVQKNLQIDGDRDFYLTHITHTQSDAGFIALRVQISAQDGKSLFKDTPYVSSVSSQNAGQPFILSQKRLFRRTSVHTVHFSVDA